MAEINSPKNFDSDKFLQWMLMLCGFAGLGIALNPFDNVPQIVRFFAFYISILIPVIFGWFYLPKNNWGKIFNSTLTIGYLLFFGVGYKYFNSRPVPEYKIFYKLADEGEKISDGFTCDPSSNLNNENVKKEENVWTKSLEFKVPPEYKLIFKNTGSVDQYYDHFVAPGISDWCNHGNNFCGDQQGMCVYIHVLDYLGDQAKKKE